MKSNRFYIIIFSVIIILVFAGMFIRLATVNIQNNEEIAREIAEHNNISEEIRIIDKQYSNGECFVLFQNNNNPVELLIYEKFNWLLGKYYFRSGHARGSSRCNEYNFSEGVGESFKGIIVAFGETKYLKESKFKVDFGSREIIQYIPNKNKYFLEVFRYDLSYGNGAHVHYDYIEN